MKEAASGRGRACSNARGRLGNMWVWFGGVGGSPGGYIVNQLLNINGSGRIGIMSSTRVISVCSLGRWR